MRKFTVQVQIQFNAKEINMFKKIFVINTEPKWEFEVFGLVSQRSSKSIRQSYQDLQGLCGVFWGH